MVGNSRGDSNHFFTVLANNIAYIKPKNRKLRSGPTAVNPTGFRIVCHCCMRPAGHCYCQHLPQIENQTEILILQHRRERSHPFNTARMVREALAKCSLICDRNESLAPQIAQHLSGNAALLFPGPDSKLLSDLDEDERPEQLVILDGTWHHAKTMLRDFPAIRDLPRYGLAPSKPGEYRIRLEPNDTSLSTVEATVQSLQALEPDTKGLDGLMNSFRAMVEAQLAHPQAKYDEATRQKKLEQRRLKKPNIPYAIIHDLENIVVAYCETLAVPNLASLADPASSDGQANHSRTNRPIMWVAKRLGSGKTFQCFLKYDDVNMEDYPDHMHHAGLTIEDFASAVPVAEFCAKWKAFMQSSDTLAVYHQSSIEALIESGVEVGPNFALKSVRLSRPDQRGNEAKNGSIHNALSNIEIPIGVASFPGRAGQRLAGLEALATHLQRQHLSDSVLSSVPDSSSKLNS